MAGHDPTSEQRADIVVRQLERFIREGRNSGGGMKFSTWQNMARSEIADAVDDAENCLKRRMRAHNRMVVAAVFCIVTVGFWGMVWHLTGRFGELVGVLVGLAGFGLVFFGGGEWLFRKAVGRLAAGRRDEAFAKIETLDKKIRRMERELDKKRQKLADDLESGPTG
jgi:hypothetical protein